MDNQNLDSVLTNAQHRGFWLKTWGLSNSPVERNQVFSQSPVCVAFPRHRNPRIPVGDVLFVYRTGARNILYVAECLEGATMATPQEMASETWRQRFSWSFPARNLTPEFGEVWNQYRLDPFRLADEFRNVNHGCEFTLHGVMFGQSAVRMPPDFAEFVIERIRGLPSPLATTTV